jgi:ribosomal-protein-alanine N-acetyltransferase
MKERPTLKTERLVLRPFTLADAPAVQRLVNDRNIASTTLNIPYPYENGMAEEWIATHQEGYEKGELINFALVRHVDNSLIGAMGLSVNQEHSRAELGYWIGQACWNQGYATEAAEAVIRYGFEVVGLNRIHASHLSRNPASGRVMQKVGMIHEGHLRQHIQKWGTFEDLEIYGLLKNDYELGLREQGRR